MSSTAGVDWQWRTRDFIVAAAIAVPLGLIWSFAYGLGVVDGARHSTAAGRRLRWLLHHRRRPRAYIIRKPGAALLGEMLAALIETVHRIGAVVLWLGSSRDWVWSSVFLATRYGASICWSPMLAGAMGALARGDRLQHVTEGWRGLEPGLPILRIILELLGGALLAGLLAK